MVAAHRGSLVVTGGHRGLANISENSNSPSVFYQLIHHYLYRQLVDNYFDPFSGGLPNGPARGGFNSGQQNSITGQVNSTQHNSNRNFNSSTTHHPNADNVNNNQFGARSNISTSSSNNSYSSSSLVRKLFELFSNIFSKIKAETKGILLAD